MYVKLRIQALSIHEAFTVKVSFTAAWVTIYIYWLLSSVNSLRPSDAIWRQWSWTTLAQVMACCLTAPSHYLNQCWLIIRGVLWHISESSFAGIAQGIDSGYEFEKDILKNIFKSPRGQWVNELMLISHSLQEYVYSVVYGVNDDLWVFNLQGYVNVFSEIECGID